MTITQMLRQTGGDFREISCPMSILIPVPLPLLRLYLKAELCLKEHRWWQFLVMQSPTDLCQFDVLELLRLMFLILSTYAMNAPSLLFRTQPIRWYGGVTGAQMQVHLMRGCCRTLFRLMLSNNISNKFLLDFQNGGSLVFYKLYHVLGNTTSGFDSIKLGKRPLDCGRKIEKLKNWLKLQAEYLIKTCLDCKCNSQGWAGRL